MSGMQQKLRQFCHWLLTWGDKQIVNREKHGIDFVDMQPLFGGLWVHHGDAKTGADGEQRESVVGELNGDILFVVFTRRKWSLRLISARRARKNERAAYIEAFARKHGLGGSGQND